MDANSVAVAGGWEVEDVLAAFSRLADGHQIAVRDDWVWMAHPFSGAPTEYRAVIGDRSWFANCAWDSLAILALLGDGEAQGPHGLSWRVDEGVVTPGGLIHLLVPARRFWDDIGFT